MARRTYGIINCYDVPLWWPIGVELWREVISVPSAKKKGGGQEEREGEEIEWRIFDLANAGALPTDKDDLDAVIITGSPRGAYEPLPWISALKEWIRAHFVPDPSSSASSSSSGAAAGGGGKKALRIVGGCFGHQVIAEALGGKVEPQGFYILASEEIRLTPAFADQGEWAKALVAETAAVAAAASSPAAASSAVTEGAGAASSSPSDAVRAIGSVRLLESHGDCVRALPPGAVRLATSSSCENEMYRVGNCFGTQSHPEFDMERVIDPILWPRATQGPSPRLSAETAAKYRATFALQRHEPVVLSAIRAFLRGE